MNKIIKAIASIMIILLICALIYIFLSYYKNKDAIGTVVFSSGDKSVSTLNILSGEYIHKETFTNNESLIDSIIKDISGNAEYLLNNSNVDEHYIKNENKDDDKSVISKETNINSEEKSTNTLVNNIISGESMINSTDKSIINKDEELLISSDPETSNQEKQEILSEIDEALKGLLEAVGKVEIVDEEKLNAALDSEVDKP